MKNTFPVYSEMNQAEPWRNELACQLNWLTAHRLTIEDTEPRVAEAIKSVVERVAKFEEISTT